MFMYECKSHLIHRKSHVVLCTTKIIVLVDLTLERALKIAFQPTSPHHLRRINHKLIGGGDGFGFGPLLYHGVEKKTHPSQVCSISFRFVPTILNRNLQISNQQLVFCFEKKHEKSLGLYNVYVQIQPPQQYNESMFQHTI